MLASARSGVIKWTRSEEQLRSILVHHILDEREATMRCSIRQFAVRLAAPACIVAGHMAYAAETQQPPAADGQPAAGEAAAKTPSAPVVIADEPKTVDPVRLLPAQLAAPATVQFKDSSLTDVVKWIREEQKIGVTLDGKALADENILLSEPVTDRLENSPLYLLLDRLRTLGLGWYMDDGMLHITTITSAEGSLATVPYNLGHLIDAGYEGRALSETIVTSTNPTSWDENGGQGGVVLLGDVLFVRNTAAVQREVAGLLAALRKHGRRTLTADAPQHAILRQKLEQNVTVNLKETPLADAIAEIARQAQADIRLDHAELRKSGVRERIPVSLELADQKLKVVLGALLAERNLTWILRDGALWITSQEEADSTMKTAVYDVRDLCRDEGESNALEGAIVSQAQGPWDVDGGIGTISFARPGVMVVSHTENQLAEVLGLLENYRTALRASKPRKREVVDPKELVTRYYRVQSPIAEDLAKFLPQLVRTETWKSPERPDAAGTIVRVSSTSDVLDTHGSAVQEQPATAKTVQQALVVHNSVLIIRQMREVHDTIAELIGKIERGDAPAVSEGGFGGRGWGGGGGLGGAFGGGGGGSFGGGYFSLPAHKH